MEKKTTKTTTKVVKKTTTKTTTKVAIKPAVKTAQEIVEQEKELVKERKVKLMLAKKTREYDDIMSALSCGVEMSKLSPNETVTYLGYKIPLVSALATTGELDLLKEAVKCGADVNVKSANGLTPLMLATETIRGEVRKDVVEFLVKNGADVNARRKGEYIDESVLTRAANYASPEIIKYLIKNGADKSLHLNDIREYQKSIHPKEVAIYDQAKASGMKGNIKGMPPYMAKKIERYKEVCSILTDAYKHKNAKKTVSHKVEKVVEM